MRHSIRHLFLARGKYPCYHTIYDDRRHWD